jgi:hypothetical protein
LVKIAEERATPEIAMSAVASFYLIPDSRLPDVLAAATPVAAGWFRSSRDAFPEVLRGSGRELDPFAAGSGWVFNTLDLYLEDRHRFMFGTFGDATISDPLSKARGSYWVALPAVAAAAGLLAALQRIDFNLADLVAFITSEHGPDDAAEEAAAAQAAMTALKAWLAQVSPGVTGLLSVG